MSKKTKYLLSVGVMLVIIMIITSMPTIIRWVRPPRPPLTDYTAELFPGVLYTRQARATPRPLLIHIVEIDVNTPGINFLVTPGDSRNGLEIPARTTSAFLEEFGVQVAINGSFSEPFWVGLFPWNYYPYSGDPVNVQGLAISNGHQYSDHDNDSPILCFITGHALIQRTTCPEETLQALAGNQLLVEDGNAVPPDEQEGFHPRTAVAVDVSGTTLWFIVVDGRQDNYSEGVTLTELSDIAIKLGADRALNLDGGGSSTLVMEAGNRAKILNAPIHRRILMFERPVANHLGVYAYAL